MVFNTTIYDPSNNNYNTNYDTYISGNNNIPLNGGKYYDNKFGKIMATFIVDGGDSVLGGNVLISNELNCYGNISSKSNNKLNVFYDQINTIAPFLNNLINVDNYQFMDENGNIIQRQNAIYGNKYYIITNGTSFSNKSIFYEIIYQVEDTVGIYLNEYNSQTNSQNYGFTNISLNSNKYIKWNYLFTLSSTPIVLYMYGLLKVGTPQNTENYLRVTASSSQAGFSSINNTEISYISGVTSNIQTQINNIKTITGPTGSSGINGNIGSTGATGATGSSGINGNNGSIGATGSTGATGSSGINGNNGSIGATGSTGATGQQGISGTTILSSNNTWSGTNNFPAMLISGALTASSYTDIILNKEAIISSSNTTPASGAHTGAIRNLGGLSCSASSWFGDSITIKETVGTIISANKGSITLAHDNTNGESSICFPSKNNSGSDYAYIRYIDDITYSGNEKSRLIIGIENDVLDSDNIVLWSCLGNGYVGVNKMNPTAALDVHGNINTDGTIIGLNIQINGAYFSNSAKQFNFGNSSDTIYNNGGIVDSYQVISSNTQLINPLPYTLLFNNGTNNIDITLPSPPNGTRLYCRKLENCTGLVTLYFPKMAYYNSIGTTNSLANSNSASYIYYNSVWYQERQS